MVYMLEIFADPKLSDRRVIIDHIIFEFDLLSELGYGMDLTRCAVSSSDQNLAYVSPKSGRAVSKEIGQPYSNKILALPSFIHSHANGLIGQIDFDNDNIDICDQDILDGFKLTGFFLEKHIFTQSDNKHDGKQRSATAQNIVNILQKSS